MAEKQAPNSVRSVPSDASPSPGLRPKSTVTKFTGFKHSYNGLLWLVFGGALFAFCLSRLPILDVHGFYRKNGGVGEYYYFTMDLYKAGLIVHLLGILFCNIFAVFQFLPIIRHKAIIIHRINGYWVFLLYLVGTAGGIVITRHAYGGHIETQTAAGALAILVLVAFAIAYVQIKRLQIDQHRKWMLRAINMMASIVTSRIILVISSAIISRIDQYYDIWSCDELNFTVNDSQRFSTMYPSCESSPVTYVKANNNYPENSGTSHRLTFGMCLWLAVAVHIILFEFYIHFTPGESERLRQMSYERQLARGFSRPGSSGIEGDIFSKRKWTPPAASSIA